jgi:urea transporter
MLSGYGQICFNDNPFSGLLFLAACFAGSPQHGISSIVATLASTAAACLLGAPRDALRLGLYSYNAALAGMGLALFVFPGQGITLAGLVYAAVLGLFCVPLTAAAFRLLSKWDIPPLALPYCVSLAVLVPAALSFARLEPAVSILPRIGGMPFLDAPSLAELPVILCNNFAEVVWQHNIVSGILLMLGILIASRIDFCSAICGACVATLFAVLFGMPPSDTLMGIHGYNAILLMIVLFGRGYAMSLKSFLFALCMAVATVPVLAMLNVLFAPFAMPVAAWPYTIVSFIALASKDGLRGLRWISPSLWGVPETIRKAR